MSIKKHAAITFGATGIAIVALIATAPAKSQDIAPKYTDAEMTAMEWCIDTAETPREQSPEGIQGCFDAIMPIAAERGR